MSSVKEHHLARKGDLVFRSRGQITTSAIILKDPGKAVVVAAPLLRIRITDQNTILPEYLNWFISQREAQIFLTSRTKISVQKMISKEAIEELEIFIPSIKKQKHIVGLASLSAREQILSQLLTDKKQQYIEKLLMNFAKGE
jgi:restriction endonuclease S subunit